MKLTSSYDQDVEVVFAARIIHVCVRLRILHGSESFGKPWSSHLDVDSVLYSSKRSDGKQDSQEGPISSLDDWAI